LTGKTFGLDRSAAKNPCDAFKTSMIEAPLSICLLLHAAAAEPRDDMQIPKVLDPRLSMELVDAKPDRTSG
jgi:hypothetical protein